MQARFTTKSSPGGAVSAGFCGRQIAIAKQLFGAMRIKRDDKDGRQDWVLRGFRRFDAPVSVVVRNHAQIPDDQAIMICVAMGWPDEVFPANPVVSQRKDLDETARFVGFEQ